MEIKKDLIFKTEGSSALKQQAVASAQDLSESINLGRQKIDLSESRVQIKAPYFNEDILSKIEANLTLLEDTRGRVNFMLRDLSKILTKKR